MAKRYEIEAKGLSGIPYRIDVFDTRFSGTVTALTADQQIVEVEGGEAERAPNKPIWPKRARMFVADNADLSPLFGAADKDIRVEVVRTDTSLTTFKGYLLTDFFKDTPYAGVSRVELRAVDGLATLKNQTLDAVFSASNSETPYTTAIPQILREIFPTGLNVEFGVEWYPDEPDLTSSDCPLSHTYFNPNNYRGDRPKGDWFTLWDTLNDLLKTHGLVLRQARPDGEDVLWQVRQRSALESDGTLKVWRFLPSGGEFLGAPTIRNYAKDLSNEGFDIQHSRTFERRWQSVSITHDHPPVENVVQEPGFEDDGANWTFLSTDTPLTVDVVDHDLYNYTPDKTQQNQKYLNHNYNRGYDLANYQFQYLTAEQEDLVDLDGLPPNSWVELKIDYGMTDAFIRPLWEVQSGSYYLARQSVNVRNGVSKGDGTVPVEPLPAPIPAGAVIDISFGDRGTITVKQRAEAGDEVIRGEISRDIDSSDTIEYVAFEPNQSRLTIWDFDIATAWHARSYRVSTTATDGTVVTSPLDLRIGVDLQEASSANDPANNKFSRLGYDDVTVVVGVGGDALDRSTVIGSVATAGKAVEITTRTNQGPTDKNLARLRGVDNNSNYFDPENWGIGVGGGTLSLEQLQAREWLRYLRNHSERLTLTFQPRNKAPDLSGHELVQFDGNNYTINRMRLSPGNGTLRVELIEHEDRGTSGITYQTDLAQSGAGAGGTSAGGSTAVGATVSGVSSVQGRDGEVEHQSEDVGKGLAIDTSPSPNQIRVAQGGIDQPLIANDAVGQAQVANDAIGSPQLADDAVTGPKVADDAVTGPKVADDAIANNHLAADAVQPAQVDETGQYTMGGLTVTGDATFQGDVTTTGDVFETEAETVKIQDNLAVINEGETGSGVSHGFAGWEVDRGTLDNFFFGFDEARDRFVVGSESTVANRQVVATREDSPASDALAYWDTGTQKWVTDSDLTWDGTDLNIGSGHATVTDRAEIVSGQWEFSNGIHGDLSVNKTSAAYALDVAGTVQASGDYLLDGGDTTALESTNYTSGWSGSDNRIPRSGRAEVDALSVRGTLLTRELEIRKLRFSKGPHIFGTGGGKIEAITTAKEDANGNYYWIVKFEEPPGFSAADPDNAKDFVLVQETEAGADAENADGTKGGTAVTRQVRAEVFRRNSSTEYRLYARVNGAAASETDYKNAGYSDPQVGDDVIVVASADNARDSSVFVDPYGPFIDVLDGISDFGDWDTRSPQVRMGWLNGVYGQTWTYGLGAGDATTSGDYLVATPSKVKVDGEIVAQSGQIASFGIGDNQLNYNSGDVILGSSIDWSNAVGIVIGDIEEDFFQQVITARKSGGEHASLGLSDKGKPILTTWGGNHSNKVTWGYYSDENGNDVGFGGIITNGGNVNLQVKPGGTTVMDYVKIKSNASIEGDAIIDGTVTTSEIASISGTLTIDSGDLRNDTDDWRLYSGGLEIVNGFEGAITFVDSLGGSSNSGIESFGTDRIEMFAGANQIRVTTDYAELLGYDGAVAGRVRAEDTGVLLETFNGKDITLDTTSAGSNGDVVFNSTVIHGSDRRMKDHISRIDDSLDVLRDIAGRRYRHRGDWTYGLLAQEVYEAGATDAVRVGDEEENWLLDYRAMHAYEVGAINALDQRTLATRERSISNEDRIEVLEEENERLRNEVERLRGEA